MSPTFTIVTAAKNALPELIRTFDSLQNQTNNDFEWVVIDAASIDGTLEWLSGLSNMNGGYKWISEKDKGIADAWNKGILLAKGSQILILNAGDTYDPMFIERFLVRVSDVRITCCHARTVSIDGKKISTFRAEPNKLKSGMFIPHNWCSVPREFYSRFGLYKLLPYSMDFEWFHRFYLSNSLNGFNVIDDVLGEYQLGGHSDINFKASFAANAEILISNGASPFSAYCIYILSSIKHWLKYRL
jgi:glycosyltransferase involved in cell wall biosynthesis